MVSTAALAETASLVGDPARANMLAALCEAIPGADVDVVTHALGSDRRIGARYLTGGLGYGGPCFPRDNVALAFLARALGTRAETEPDGTQSISFPAPGSPAAETGDGIPDYVPFSTAPVTVSRSALDDIRSSASSACVASTPAARAGPNAQSIPA